MRTSIVVPAPSASHKHSFSWSRSLLSPKSTSRGDRKAHCTVKEGHVATQGNLKWNSEFYFLKKEELEENSIYSFKKEAPNKKIVLGK